MRALALGVLAALSFASLAGVNLGSQGPQYDELHQAVGAFTWLGAPAPQAFCLDWRGICVLNTSYSAALKTHLYGLFLRLSGRGFVLTDWRWLGILLMSVGLVLFAALARPLLQPGALAVLLALLLTDGSLLLLGRFDWGPVALAWVLRLAMIGIWLRGQAADPPAPTNSAGIALLAGLATFEKLSSAVLCLPLAAMLLFDPKRRRGSHFLAAAAGLGAGLLPLLAVNLGWLLAHGELISLRNLAGGPKPGVPAFVEDYLALGNGAEVESFMLALASPRTADAVEAVLLVGALVAAGFAGRRGRTAGIALASYGLVGAGLFLLPRPTWAHHWLLGTPWQYTAVALALPALLSPGGDRRRRAAGFALAGLVVVWIGMRLPGLVSLERALWAGRSSAAWDPSLAALGGFAARHPDAVFVASDWGVATQIHCWAEGRAGAVHEPFWNGEMPDLTGKDVLYLVRLRTPTGRFPATARIERALESDPRWQEVPVEPEAQRLKAVRVRKLRRTPTASTLPTR